MGTRIIKKGDWVRAVWFEATKCSLAGVNPKIGAVSHEVCGMVTHVRGDHPTEPISIRIWVKPDDDGEEVIVQPEWIVQHVVRTIPFGK